MENKNENEKVIAENQILVIDIYDELDALTDTGKAIVAAAVKRIKADIVASEQRVIEGVEKVIEQRETKARSFWRAVFDAVWSGVSHGHALLQKLFKE